MKQGKGTDVLGANDPRSDAIGVIYVSPDDDRKSVMAAILTQEKLGRKQVAVVLPEQNKAFQRPSDFDDLKTMRRKMQTRVVFIAPSGPGPAEFARQRRFFVYSSLESYAKALRDDTQVESASKKGWLFGSSLLRAQTDNPHTVPSENGNMQNLPSEPFSPPTQNLNTPTQEHLTQYYGTMFIRPEEDLTTVRELLEQTPAHYITLVIPADTQLRSHVAWKLLRARVRELGKEVQIVSDSAQVRSVARDVNFKVASSLEASPTGKSRSPSRPGRVLGSSSGSAGSINLPVPENPIYNDDNAIHESDKISGSTSQPTVPRENRNVRRLPIEPLLPAIQDLNTLAQRRSTQDESDENERLRDGGSALPFVAGTALEVAAAFAANSSDDPATSISYDPLSDLPPILHDLSDDADTLRPLPVTPARTSTSRDITGPTHTNTPVYSADAVADGGSIIELPPRSRKATLPLTPRQPVFVPITPAAPSENRDKYLPTEPLSPPTQDLNTPAHSQNDVPVLTSLKAVNIFYCYAREDKPLRDELAKHLHSLIRKRYITEWYDREIQAGMDWRQEIKTHLDTADIILLLVSADFISSDYCYSVEMERALERHKRGNAHVIPIILRPAYWEETPLGDLQVLPTDALPVTLWQNRDQAFLDIVHGIRKVIRQSLSLED